MPKLAMSDPSGREKVYDIPAQPQVWGRGEDSDVILGSRSVTRHHMRIHAEGRRIMVEDLTGGQGLKLDGKEVSGTFELKPGQELEAGVFVFRVHGVVVEKPEDKAEEKAPPPLLRGVRGATKGVEIELRDGPNDIGRDQSAYVVIDDASISRLHARIIVEGPSLQVTDLRSSNGTFVNQRRVETCNLSHGDLIRFGNMDFRLILGGNGKPLAQKRKKLVLIGIGSLVGLLIIMGTCAKIRANRNRNQAVDTEPVERELPLEIRVEQQLRAARLAMDNLNWKEAERAAEAAYQLHPISTEARKLKEQIQKELANETIYNEATNLYDLNKWQEAYTAFGKIPQESAYYKKIKYKLSELHKKISEYRLSEAKSYFRAQNYSRAQENFIEYMKLNPCAKEVYNHWIKKNEAKMRYYRMRFTPFALDCREAPAEAGSAMSEVDQLEMLRVRYPDENLYEAMRLYFSGKGKLAIEALRRVKSSTRDPQKAAVVEEAERAVLVATAKYGEGLSLLMEGRLKEARDRLVLVLEQDEKLMPPGVKSFYRESSGVKLAERFYKEGLTMFGREEYEKAFDLWKQCLEVHSDNTNCAQGMIQLENVSEEALQYAAKLEAGDDPSAINVWKNVMRMTRPDSLPYKKAQAKLKEYGQ